MSASTLCNNGTATCGQADCQNSNGTASCAVGQGFAQPATQAEITMLIANGDSYDVEVINGFHLPISMAPSLYVTPNNYNCGVPGSNTAGNGFGACIWTSTGPGVGAIPPSNAYYWVQDDTPAVPCSVSAPSCPTNQVCGLDSSFNQTCGVFLGYWTADQACGTNATANNAFFNCNLPLSTTSPPFPANSTLSQLMLCKVPKDYTGPNFNTCYGTYPSYSAAQITTCCGCQDWWLEGIGANDTAQSCTKPGGATQSDPTWQSDIKGQVSWLKSACPSDYVYTFDDATSGFSCTNNLPGSPNSEGYTITFCSGGDSGLPQNVTDGRL